MKVPIKTASMTCLFLWALAALKRDMKVRFFIEDFGDQWSYSLVDAVRWDDIGHDPPIMLPNQIFLNQGVPLNVWFEVESDEDAVMLIMLQLPERTPTYEDRIRW